MRVWSSPPEDVRTVLVTGGAGFIGSNFLHLVVPRFPGIHFVNLDSLTYAGNLESLSGISEQANYSFVKADLADASSVRQAVQKYLPDWVFHFAAETHVDRSIKYPIQTVLSNVIGTLNLLETTREAGRLKLFHHVSTDEVFGSLGKTGAFNEATPYDPSSPYSASKAGSDHLVRAYARTYQLPTLITNCSNNYGPRQFPEKLMPVMILAASEGKPLPVYGDGSNVRDWLYVDDHAHAIWELAHRGKRNETYCVGGKNERSNLDIVKLIATSVAKHLSLDVEQTLGQITFVADRPGHDWRYAIDPTKIERELGWQPAENMESGIEKTVSWYLENQDWVASVRSGDYLEWMKSHYGDSVSQQQQAQQ
jgi:dTDP-glucose 4,6-dehydratase